jgi:NAD-dependent deacetylase
MKADIFIIIGTSLVVYPAAGLVQYVPAHAPIYLIDPGDVRIGYSERFEHYKMGASAGMRKLYAKLVK